MEQLKWNLGPHKTMKLCLIEKIYYTASEFKFKLIKLNWKISFSIALITFQFLNSHMWLVVTQLETKPFINQREFIEEKIQIFFF